MAAAAVRKTLEIPANWNAIIDEVVKGLGFSEYKLTMTPATIKGDNYMGEVFKISVDGVGEDGFESSSSLIVKIPCRSPMMKQIVDLSVLFRREYFVYTEMLLAFDEIQNKFKVPRRERPTYATFYKGVLNKSEELLIMEDLTPKGYKMYDRLQPLTYEHMEACLKELAKFHAMSFVLKAVDAQKYEEFAGKVGKFADFSSDSDMLFNKCVEVVKSVCDDHESIQKITEYVDRVKQTPHYLVDGVDSTPYNVICHGDFWMNNILYKYDREKIIDVKIIDWQFIKHSSPILDLSTLIYSATDRNFRVKNLSKLLDSYYKALSSSTSKMNVDLEQCFPLDIFRMHIKKYMFYGVLLAFMFLPMMLSRRGECPEITTLVDHVKTTEKLEIPFTNYCKERLKGVVEDFVEYLS